MWKSHYLIAYFGQPQYGIWAGYINETTKTMSVVVSYGVLSISNLQSNGFTAFARIWNGGTRYTYYFYYDQPA